MGNYLLSVDGGGTKTELCVSTPEGVILDRVAVGCSNYKSVGLDAVEKSLGEGLELLKEKGFLPESMDYSVWGISGCDSEHDFELVRGILKKLGIPENRSYLCNDGILAFYAQAQEPGIVLIAGTGSIILGIDENGHYKRAGGWGYNISDIGSGYWIGAEALKGTLLYCDGCGTYAPLWEMIREAFQCPDFETLPYIVTEVTDYYEIAGLARLVVDGAEQGDQTALGILKEGASLLADMVASIYQRMGFSKDLELSMVFSGGVLQSRVYRQLVKDGLKERISLDKVTFTIQENTPSYGGIKLAKRMNKSI